MGREFYSLLAVFAILALSGLVYPCQVISSPGTTTLSADASGWGTSLDGVTDILRACIVIASDDVIFDCGGYSVTNDGTSETGGIVVNGSASIDYTNVTIRNCPSVSGYEAGIYLHMTSQDTIHDSVAHNNTAEGIYLYDSNYNTLANDTAYYNTNYGFFLSGSSNNDVSNNTAYNHTYNGFHIYTGSSYNNVTSNSAFNNSDNGFRFNSNSKNIVLNNDAHNNSAGFYFFLSHNNTVLENDAYNNSNSGYSFRIAGSENNTFADNNAYSPSQYGFYLYTNSEYNTLENNTADGNYWGFRLDSVSNNDFTNNTALDNYLGFYLSGSSYSTLTNNRANTTSVGFYIYSSSNYNTLTDNEAYGNPNTGIRISGSSSNNLIGNTAYSNSQYGIRLDSSASNNNLTDNTVFSNIVYGIHLSTTSGTIISNCTIYGNQYGFYAQDSDYAIQTTSLLPRGGTYENYTNLSVTDTMGALEEYSVNWSDFPGSTPTSRSSFAQKYLNITTQAGTPGIDEITFHWLTSELTGYNESAFELWKFNSSTGWTLLNDTPDTTNNYLKLYALNPQSIYGILQYEESGCQVISSPGTVTLTGNASGAPNALSGVTGITQACIVIASSDVTFDCSGYSITNDGTSSAAGIVVNGSASIDYTGVTIQNCPSVSQYEYGIYLHRTTQDTIQNSTAHNNTEGVHTYLSGYNNVTNNTAHNNSQGIRLEGATGNSITDNTIHNNTQRGIYLYSSADFNDITNNTIYNNSLYGIEVESSHNNTFTNNTVYANAPAGFLIYSGSDNNFTGNIAHDNINRGFSIASNSNRNNFINNTAYGHANYGFYLYAGSSYNSLVNNTAYDSYVGFLASSASWNIFTNDTAYGNSHTGIYISSSTGNNVSNCTLYDNTYDLYLKDSNHSIETTLLLPDSGELTNYTNISLTDTMGASEEYFVNWSDFPGSMPSSRSSFSQKYVNITTQAGTPSIDEITFHWLTSEASGYDESYFELWKFNSSTGWTLLNNTPDTTNNYLKLYALNPASIYGILEVGNLPPVVENATLNTSLGLNTTEENLRLFYDAYDQDSDILLNLLFGYGSNSTWTRDYSRYGNNGTATSALWNYSGGHDGQGAYEFDGDGDGSNIATPNMNLTDTFTISAFHNPISRGEATYGRLFGKLQNIEVYVSSDVGFTFLYYNSSVNTNSFSAPNCFTMNQWNHFAAVVNSTHIEIYCNGESIKLQELNGGINTPSTHLYVGNDPTLTREFNGSIDDVVIYNRALSVEEIVKLYGQGTAKAITNWYVDGDPIALLNMPFEGGSNSTYTKDYSNYSSDGTVVNAIWNSTGGYDGWGAYEFDGIDTYINLGDEPEFNMTDNDFSISVWVKGNETGSQYFLTKGPGWVAHGGTSAEYAIAMQNPYIFFSVGNGTASSQAYASSNTDTWRHIVGVKNSNGLYLYINGVLQDTGVAITGSVSNSYPLLIGIDFDESGIVFNGTIDDLVIYNRSLTAEEIWNLYSNNTREMPHEETRGGETWYSCITPNDGTEDGTEVCSNSVTLDETQTYFSNVAIYALNGSRNLIGGESAFNFTNLETIEYLQARFTVVDEDGIGTIGGYFTANGTNGCSLGNNQSSMCYNYSDGNWINYIEGADTDTFRNLGNAGDQINCSYNGTSTHRDYTCEMDEHYNPNVWKHYPLNFSDVKWQTGSAERIKKSTIWKVEIDTDIVPLDATYYKLDFRVNYTGAPTQPIIAYLCNSTYSTGDPATSEYCALVASKLPSQLQDDGTKFRAVFTKNLTSELGDIRYALVTSSAIGSNYYGMKTYGWLGTGSVVTEISNNNGNTYAPLSDGYETELNINWFYNGTDGDVTQLVFKLWANDTGSLETNSSEYVMQWLTTGINEPPIVQINSPEAGANITSSQVEINWTTAEPDGDVYHTNISASNGVDTIMIATSLPVGADTYNWSLGGVSAGLWNITVQSCENDTAELYCGNNTRQINVSNSYISDCWVINSSGEYALMGNISGANPLSGVSYVSQACIVIASSDVTFDCGGYSITNNGTADAAGIIVNGSVGIDYTNVVIQNCPSVSQYEQGIYLHRTTQDTIRDSTMWNNTLRGVLTYISTYNNITNNTIYNNTRDGIYLFTNSDNNLVDGNTLYDNDDNGGISIYSSNGNIVSNNTAYNNSYGIFLDSAGSNLVENNSAYNNSVNGFTLATSANYNTLANNTAYGNPTNGFSVISSSSLNNLTDNVAYNNRYGFYVYNSANNNNLENNTAYENYDYGLYLLTCSNNSLLNNTARNNSQGIRLEGATGNDITDNIAYYNSNGIDVTSSADNNRFINNSAYNNSGYNLYLTGSSYNLVENNTAHDAGTYGFFLYNADYNNLTGNTAYDNTRGFYIHFGSDYNAITNSTSYGNSAYGFYLREGTGNTVGNCTVYGNVYDIYLDDSNYSMETTLILPGNGQLTNYTNISITDTMGAAERYSIDWDSFSSAMPSNRLSFSEKYVNITTQAGTPSIDEITFHWLTAELTGYYESYFELWKFNSSTGWTLLNNTPDTASNAIKLYALNPASIYGILQFNASDCQVISSPGTHMLLNDISGADPLSGVNYVSQACIVIASSNVTFDCNGSSITNNGTADAAGVVVNGSSAINYTNVTIRNCPSVSQYEIGIYLYNTSQDTIRNSTAYNNTANGIRVYSSGYNSIINSSVYENSASGIYIQAQSDYNTVSDNTMHGNSGSGILLYLGDNANTLSNNTLYNQTYGIYLYSTTGTNMTNCTLYNNRYGLYALDSNYTMQTTALLPESGEFTNYTNLSITDTMAASEQYSVNWSSFASSMPSARLSFSQKYVNITTQAGTPSIDEITFHWLTAELTGYYESYFELWKFNSSTGWTLLNNTPDTTNNYLKLYALNPQSIYGILQFNASYCQVISSPGAYTLLNNLSGANPVADVTAISQACIVIASSNVTFDCGGYSITNNGTADAAGIVVNGSTAINYTNVTIQNCPSVSQYEQGIYLHRTARDTIRNSTGRDDTSYGITLYLSDYNTISNNSASNNTMGMVIWTGSHNNLTDNIAYDNGNHGFLVTSGSSDNILANNTGYNNTNAFYLSTISGNTLSNNTAYNNTQHGFYLYSSSGNILSNSTAYGNAGYGFYVESSTGNTMAGCTIYSNQYGLYAQDSNYTMQTTYFLPESGAFTTYANLSITDVMGTSEAYSVNWSAFSASMPTERNSFAQKYANITAQAGTPGIDEITFHWLSSELTGYNESYFELWKFNSSDGWTLLNNTPDTSNNYLKLYTINPQGIYGILQYNDTTPPTITIESPENTTYNTSSIDLNYTTDGDACWYSLDGGAINTSISDCSNTTLYGLNDSQHYLTVYVNDSVNNTNSSTVYFIVDTTPPTISISSPANTTYNTTSVPLQYTTNADTCGYTIDGGSYTNLPGCANTTLTSLTDTQHYVTVYVNDTINNSNSSTVYFIVDTTPPTISISSPANTTYNTTSVPLQYTTNADTCGYTIDGGSYTNLPGCANTTLTSLTDTQHYLTVYVNDSVNNTNSSTVYFIVDATPPTITITSPANTTYNTTSVPLQYTTNADTCGYTIDGGSYTNLPGCANTTLITLSDTQHYVTVYVNDSINNTNSSTVYFIVDTTPPTISISSPANTTYNTTSVPLQYTTNADTCGYTIDGGSYTNLPGCANTTLITLSDTQHYVTVYVNDSINNTNSSTVYFIVDTTPPTISISSPANTTYNISSIDLNYTTNANTCGYTIDGGAINTSISDCSNTTLYNLDDAQHYVTVHVNDSINNTNASTVYFIVDADPPTITIESPENTTYAPGDIQVNYTTNGINCTLFLDGSLNQSLPTCTNTTIGNLSDGSHNLTIYANDSMGRTSYAASLFVMGTGEEPGGGHEPQEPECESDSDCSECYYCSIAAGECILKSESECAYDGDCSALGGGYTCDSCACIAPECVTSDDCDEGEYCSDYHCTEIPECITNYDCENDEYCSDNNCLEVECDCGEVKDHGCRRYECCDDSDCGHGYGCRSHSCILLPEAEGTDVGGDSVEGPSGGEEPPATNETVDEITEETTPSLEQEELEARVSQEMWESVYSGIWVGLFLILLIALLYAIFFGIKRKRREE